MSSYFNQAASVGVAGYGLYGQIDRALHGTSDRVHFLRGNKTFIEFDGCLSEDHGQSAAPTQFGIEDGGTVSDHIMIAPPDLSLTTIISDSPLSLQDPRDLQMAVTTPVVAAAFGPIAAVGILGQAAGFAAIAAQEGSVSRSTAAYNQLVREIGGDLDGSGRTFPVPFDVVTKLRIYRSMILSRLNVSRDSSSGNALVFSMTLSQVRVVSAQQVLVAVAQPAKAAKKKVKPEEELVSDAVSAEIAKGTGNANQSAAGSILKAAAKL